VELAVLKPIRTPKRKGCEGAEAEKKSAAETDRSINNATAEMRNLFITKKFLSKIKEKYLYIKFSH